MNRERAEAHLRLLAEAEMREVIQARPAVAEVAGAVVTVVLTDGYTPWPPAAPKGMRVVVGLLGPGAPDLPPWARAVRVEED
jgi:hypothetical protein